jgi:hypothetical protein
MLEAMTANQPNDLNKHVCLGEKDYSRGTCNASFQLQALATISMPMPHVR